MEEGGCQGWMGIRGLEVQKEPLKAQTQPEGGQGAEERPCSRELGVLLLHLNVHRLLWTFLFHLGL